MKPFLTWTTYFGPLLSVTANTGPPWAQHGSRTAPVTLFEISPFATPAPEDITLSARGFPASLWAQGDRHRQGEAVQ